MITGAIYKTKDRTAKPFLKWAGGKSQLLNQLDAHLPKAFKEESEKWMYFEPMVGGGALFFRLASQYKLAKLFISDINPSLVMGYETIKRDVDKLIGLLTELENSYLRLSEPEREAMYYQKRREYNLIGVKKTPVSYGGDWITNTSLLIFLNRTCYNGLYRVNQAGEFNVPFGNYKNPRVCDEDNLNAVAKCLAKTTIRHGEYYTFSKQISAKSFVYFDPPYRPISTSSSFTSYTNNGFGDKEQSRLAGYFRELDEKGALLMLSNSDPRNEDASDRFFQKLYKGYKIHSVTARRNINSLPSKRGNISELLITNY